MKSNKEIAYTKEGRRVEQNLKLLTKKKIINDILVRTTKQEENFENYNIRNEIEELKLTNITFNKNVQFELPQDTKLILDSCTFKSPRIELIGGSIEIINPNLISCGYSNYIYFSRLENLNIRLKKDNKSFINIKGHANNCSIDLLTRINMIDNMGIEAKELKLTNIIKPRQLILKGNNIKIENCEIDIKEEDIIAETLNCTNSTIYAQNSNINIKNILLKNSKVYYGMCYNQEGLNCDNLVINNSTINSQTNLTINSKRIIIDELSNLIASNAIKIQNEIITNENEDEDIILTKQKIKLLKENIETKKKVKKRIRK